jgi:hypothetical protein
MRSSVSSYFATRQFVPHDFSAETTFGPKSSTGRCGRASGHRCYCACDSKRESATDAESINAGEIRHCRRKCCAESGCAREVGRDQAPEYLLLISCNREQIQLQIRPTISHELIARAPQSLQSHVANLQSRPPARVAELADAPDLGKRNQRLQNIAF